ncbi:MAG: 4Fe-4S cluster-binding domain-containing protein [Desulfatiglans sp.]|nr:4Fe-4S cluster-binding domain-containing protein [Desulfatiglans sp.]
MRNLFGRQEGIQTGEGPPKRMDMREFYRNCRLCPRSCGANRLTKGGNGNLGFCGETDRLRVAYVGPHFGEEPPISGTKGAGTVFLSGCSLRCSYCQNYQISQEGVGADTSLTTLFRKIQNMIHVHQVHNISFITPDHFFPHIFDAVSLVRKNQITLPVVFNLSGYQSLDLLRVCESYAEIYIPDFKYADPRLARQLSRCPDYPHIALEAISEMIRQKGFLEVSNSASSPATQGVLVRHLILPGNVGNSIDALTSLFIEFGPGLPLSLMSQYHPVLEQKDDVLNRSLLEEEFQQVYSHATDLGFEHLFVQFPDDQEKNSSVSGSFLPDFRSEDPFAHQQD